MAARPNALRIVTESKRQAENQLVRLRDTVSSVDSFLATTGAGITPADYAHYRACLSTAHKQFKLLTQLAALPLPEITLGDSAVLPARGPGRPPKNPVQPLESTLSASVAVATMPKRRGRPPKNPQAVAAPVAQAIAPSPAVSQEPKRRGRPPKLRQVELPHTQAAAPVAAAPKRRGRPPKNPQAVAAVQAAPVAPAPKPVRTTPAAGPAAQHAPRVAAVQAAPVAQANGEVKRGPGRPKGSTNKPRVEAAVNMAPISDGTVVKRGPGRPKGSTNKPRVVNGSNELQQTG